MREVPPGNGIGLVTPSVYCNAALIKPPNLSKGPQQRHKEHQPYNKYRV